MGKLVQLTNCAFLNLSSHVGNTMATFVMQALGCEVSALNTVHYSTLDLYICVQ